MDRGLVDLDEPAGPEGSTVRHLLAHTAGYAFDGDETVGSVGSRRIYSNTGFEVLAAHLEDATGYDYADWMEQTVVAGLDLVDLEVSGSPAAGYRGSIRDLLAVGRELLAPTLIPEDLWREATGVQFPGLSGSCPADGEAQRLAGLRDRGQKDPHWTGAPPRDLRALRGGVLLCGTRCAGSLPFLGEEPSAPST